jgi:hypothetical protein
VRSAVSVNVKEGKNQTENYMSEKILKRLAVGYLEFEFVLVVPRTYVSSFRSRKPIHSKSIKDA